MIKRPALRYHGGKWRIAKWIIKHIPAHRVYVEPFGGAASVLLQKPRSHTEVYNDLWGDVVNVFRVLRDPVLALQLRQACELTPFSRTEMLACDEPSDDPVESARRLIFRSFSGFGSAAANSLHKTGFRSNSRASGQAPAMDWCTWPSVIPAFTERLRGVVIENRQADKLIIQHDSPDTVFYLDPPYVQSTRGMRRRNASYAHELTDHDHTMLAAALANIEGTALISGYRCDLYDDLYGTWARTDRLAYADGAQKRTESLWIKYGAKHRLNACTVDSEIRKEQNND